MSRRHKVNIPRESEFANIDSLNHDGRGVAHVNGKTVFVEGALPGEQVEFSYTSMRKSYAEGIANNILQVSPERVAPKCAHYGLCGGCNLQHLASEEQIHAKQQILLDNLKHLGHVTPDQVLAPLRGAYWGYRRKARLGVKYVIKKGKVLVGFRERHSRFLAELTRCEILHPSVGTIIPELSELIGNLQAYNQIPQIEIAVADSATAMVIRHLVELSASDLAKLREFAQCKNLLVYLQPKGPDSVTLFWPDQAELSYRLDEFDIEIFFHPTHFTQVNAEINTQMVTQALGLLDPQANENILDLFCGLGNFTLPMARHTASVIGVEGDSGLVAHAKENAQRNGISNTTYYVSDLAQGFIAEPWMKQKYDKILLDPPRTGAFEIVKNIRQLGAKRIVYVSCNPSTLARDADVLVNTHGYRLKSAGVMDMFPHTAHVESMALFETKKAKG